MKAIMHWVLNFSKESMISWTPHVAATLYSNDCNGDSLPTGNSTAIPVSGTGGKSQKDRSFMALKGRGNTKWIIFWMLEKWCICLIDIRLNERNSKTIQKTPKRTYGKYLIADRFSFMGGIIKGLTWWGRTNYYVASVISLHHPSSTTPWEKQLSLWTVSAPLDLLDDPVAGGHCTLSKSQGNWVILKKHKNTCLWHCHSQGTGAESRLKLLGKDISSLHLREMCYLLCKYKCKNQS